MDIKKIAGLIIVVGIVILTAVTFYGQSVAQQKIDLAISDYDLGKIVQYDSVSFNPFTLTPSLNNVVVGQQGKSILLFDQISFHNYDVNKRKRLVDIDVSYQLETVPVNDAPIDIKEMLVLPVMTGLSSFGGGGRVVIDADGEDLNLFVSAMVDDISGVELDLSAIYDGELKTEGLGKRNLLSPFGALGAIQSLGDDVYFETLTFKLKDDGFLDKWLPQSTEAADYDETEQFDSLAYNVEGMGLAKATSFEAENIAHEVMAFIASPNTFTVSVEPEDPVSLSDVLGFLQKKQAYKRLGMDISS